MLAKYQNKHVFLSEYSSTHIFNLISNIINKGILKTDDILVILYSTYPTTINNESMLKKSGVKVLLWQEAKNLEISFKSLNPLSLTSHNSSIICYFLDKSYVKPSSVNILLQDDEVDRWNKLYKQINRLEVSNAALLDEYAIKVLRNVDNYICPYNTMGIKFKRIVSRKINIIDAVLPFNLIDYNSQETLELLLSKHKESKVKDTYNIIVTTKPSGISYPLKSLKVLTLLLFKSNPIPSAKKINISLWASMSLRVTFCTRLLNKLFRVRKIPLQINLVATTPHLQYFLMMNNHDCLILQPRGGFSTAKYFAEKVGKVITISDTTNDLAFRKNYGIHTFNTNSLEAAIDMALKSAGLDESNQLNNHSQLIKKRHEVSFSKLKEYWSNFD